MLICVFMMLLYSTSTDTDKITWSSESVEYREYEGSREGLPTTLQYRLGNSV